MPRSWPCWQLQLSRLPSRGVASLPSRRSTAATSPRRSRSCWSNGCGGLTPAGDSHRPLRQPQTAADPTFGAFVEALYERLLALGPEVVSNALAYYQRGGENLVSADGHAALPVLTLAGDMDGAGERAEHIRAVVRGLDGQQGFRVLHTGQASALRHQRNSVMGLGVGIDYCPFIIYRYREERAQVLNQVEAIAATGDTARRAVSLAALPSSPPCRPC